MFGTQKEMGHFVALPQVWARKYELSGCKMKFDSGLFTLFGRLFLSICWKIALRA